MTPECTVAWRNYECKVNVTGYERRTQDAFVAGWSAHEGSVASPAVGHVCEGSPTGRKPGLCWICGQALPHDCIGSAQPIGATQGSVTVCAQPAEALANRLAVSSTTLDIPVLTEPWSGRKWPIGTPSQVMYTGLTWGTRLAAAREHASLTLDALARRLDPPRTRKDISAMEHGRRGLSVELCAQLADALDCDRLWLAGWTL